jgi:hypothetical protein
LFASHRPVACGSRQPQLVPKLGCLTLLIETMEDMKLIYPNPHLDVRALKKSLQAAA